MNNNEKLKKYERFFGTFYTIKFAFLSNNTAHFGSF